MRSFLSNSPICLKTCPGLAGPIIAGGVFAFVLLAGGICGDEKVTASETADQTRTRAVEGAADAAFGDLVDRVLALQLGEQLTMAGLLVMVPDAECWLRSELLKASQRGRPRTLDGDAVEVTVFVPAGKLTSLMKDIAVRYLPQVDPAQLMIEGLTEKGATGTGRSSPSAAKNAPIGWRHCTAHQLTLASTAARIDLVEKLLTRIADWPISTRQTLGMLFAERPDLRQAAWKGFLHKPVPKPTYEPAGVCHLPMEFHRAEIVAILTAAGRACTPLIEEDLTRAIDPKNIDPLVLDGYAVAPPATPSISSPTKQVVRPAWADRTLSASVTCKKGVVATVRIELRRQLWLSVEKLKLPDGVELGEILTSHPNADNAIATIRSGITFKETPEPTQSDTSNVSAAIDLDLVWQAVRGLSNDEEHPGRNDKP